jgi:hypothetical protein
MSECPPLALGFAVGVEGGALSSACLRFVPIVFVVDFVVMGRGWAGPVVDSFMDRFVLGMESDGVRFWDFVGSRGAIVGE